MQMKTAAEANLVETITVLTHAQNLHVVQTHFVQFPTIEQLAPVVQDLCQIHRLKSLAFVHQRNPVRKIVNARLEQHVLKALVKLCALLIKVVLITNAATYKLVFAKPCAEEMMIVELEKFATV